MVSSPTAPVSLAQPSDKVEQTVHIAWHRRRLWPILYPAVTVTRRFSVLVWVTGLAAAGDGFSGDVAEIVVHTAA